MNTFISALAISLALSVTPWNVSAQQAPTQEGNKVLYHVDDAQSQGLKGLRNIRNHLDVAPKTILPL